MTEAPAAASSRRGKLTAERERELLRATLDLVAEIGYDQLTMAAVAKRAKCSTATLYRQWESKPRLVVSALKAHQRDRRRDFARVDTGTLRGDMEEIVGSLLDEDPAKDSIPSLQYAIVRDEDLKHALREILIHPVLDDLHQVLQRAVDRGEIEPGNRVIGLVEHLLLGPWVAEQLLYGRPATQELMESIVDAVLLPALTARTPSGTPTTAPTTAPSRTPCTGSG